MHVGRRVGSVRHACRTQGGVCQAWVYDAGRGLSGMCVGCRMGYVRHACRTQGGVCEACA